MVLTKTVDVDIFDNDHPAMSLLEECIIDDAFYVVLVTFCEEQKRVRIPQRCGLEAFPVRILPNALEQRSHGATHSV